MIAQLSSVGLLLLPVISAHFQLDYPASRGFDEDNLGKFPCGGQDTVTANRTDWPVAGGPIDLTMGHDQAVVQVLLGLGNDVGSNFNITLLPIVQEQGLGKFCMSDVRVPANAGVKDGMNATIQVITNGDPNGGLYNCADITFRTSAPQPGACKNNTGVTTRPYTGQNKNANETSGGSSSSSSTSGQSSSTATSSSTAPAATASKAGAADRLGMQWGLGGVLAGALGFAIFL